MSLWILSINGLAKDCGNSSALALELPQACAKPWINRVETKYAPFGGGFGFAAGWAGFCVPGAAPGTPADTMSRARPRGASQIACCTLGSGRPRKLVPFSERR